MNLAELLGVIANRQSLPSADTQQEQKPQETPQQQLQSPSEYIGEAQAQMAVQAAQKVDKYLEEKAKREVQEENEIAQIQRVIPPLNVVKKQYAQVPDDVLAKALYWEYVKRQGYIPLDKFYKAIGYQATYKPSPLEEVRILQPELKEVPDDVLIEALWYEKQRGRQLPWFEGVKDKDEFIKKMEGESKILQELKGGVESAVNFVTGIGGWFVPMAAQLGVMLRGLYEGKSSEEIAQEGQEAARIAKETISFENRYPGKTGKVIQAAEHLILLPFEIIGKGVEKVLPYEKYPIANVVANLLGGLAFVKAVHVAGQKAGIFKKSEPIKDEQIREAEKQAVEGLKEAVKQSPERDVLPEDHPAKPLEEKIRKNPDISTDKLVVELEDIQNKLAEDKEIVSKLEERAKEKLREEKPEEGAEVPEETGYTLKDLLSEEETYAEQKPETGQVYEGMPEQRVQAEEGTARETMPTYEGGERVGGSRLEITEERQPEEVTRPEIKTEETQTEGTQKETVTSQPPTSPPQREATTSPPALPGEEPPAVLPEEGRQVETTPEIKTEIPSWEEYKQQVSQRVGFDIEGSPYEDVWKAEYERLVAEKQPQPIKVEDYQRDIRPGDYVKFRYVDKKGKVHEGEGKVTDKVGKLPSGFVYREIITPEGKKLKMPWTSKAEYYKLSPPKPPDAIPDFTDYFYSGGPGFDQIKAGIDKMFKEIEEADVSKVVKEDLSWFKDKLYRILLPSYLRDVSDIKPFKYVFDKWQEIWRGKNNRTAEKLAYLNQDGLVSQITANKKLHNAFNSILFTLDEHSQDLAWLDKREGIGVDQIGDQAYRMMETIARNLGLTSEEYNVVKTVYERWFHLKNEIYREIVQELNQSYKERIARLDSKINELKEKLAEGGLEEKEADTLRRKIAVLEDQRIELQNEWEQRLNQTGFIKYYAPHMWHPTSHVLIIRDKFGNVVHREAINLGEAVKETVLQKSLKAFRKKFGKEFPESDYKYEIIKNEDPWLSMGDYNQEMAGLQRLLENVLKKSDLDENLKAEVREAYWNWLKSRGFMSRFIKRKEEPVTGYVRNRGLEVISKYIAGYEGMKAKKEFIQSLLDMPRGNIREMNLVNDYVYNIIRNENMLDRFGAKVRSLLFLKYIAWKVNAPIRNLTQPYTMTMPYLLQEMKLNPEFGKYQVGKVLREIQKAQKQSLRIAKDIMTVKDYNELAQRLDKYDWLSPEDKANIIQAYKDGIFSQNVMQEWSGRTQAGFRTGYRKFVELGGAGFHWSDVSNRVTTLLADTRLFHDYDHAIETVRKTQFIYNKSDIPIALGKGTAMSTAGRIAYTFMSYPLNELRLWAELLKNKQYLPFATSLAVLGLLGGAEAIPLIAFIKSMATKKTGVDIDEYAKKHFNPELYTLIMHGLPSLIGIDASTQFGFSLPFMNSYAMTNNDNAIEYIARNLLGAFYNTFKDFEYAWRGFEMGDWEQVVRSLSPRAVANLLNAYFSHKYGVRNYSKFPIWVYDEKLGHIRLNSFETISKALGFQPLKLSEYYSHQGNKQLLKDYWGTKKKFLLHQLKMNIATTGKVPRQLAEQILQYDLKLQKMLYEGKITVDEFKMFKINPKLLKPGVIRSAKDLRLIDIELEKLEE